MGGVEPALGAEPASNGERDRATCYDATMTPAINRGENCPR